MMMDEIVKLYGMKPHPEGGFFVETYRAQGAARFPGFQGERNFSTAIYYLVPPGVMSTLHRIKSDEMWHFYLGGPMVVAEIHPDGKVVETTLGQDIRAGHKLQHTVPAGAWFGGYCLPGSPYSLIGLTVSPGFDFADFEIAKRENLLKSFPHAERLIRSFYPG